jgi:hypothetical protein
MNIYKEIGQMDRRNHEHYKDTTAYDAIKAAAAIDEFEVFGRIKLRDMKTGKIYR